MKRLSFIATLSLLACTEAVGPDSEPAGAGGNAAGGGDPTQEGTELSVEVPADGKIYVDLDGPAVLEGEAEEWELAFAGYDLFTNSGVSGPGAGGAFGPLEAPVFLLDERPEVPFLVEDRTGGAFLDWYAYEGATHALWSRYHVYGLEDGGELFKVQLLSYYGEVSGAPVGAIYRLRWARVDPSGVGPTQEVADLDGTAGGLEGTPDDPAECLDLGTGERAMLDVDAALASIAWHLCFRRDAISVNGEVGGPRGVAAVDLDRSPGGAEEPLEEIKMRTAESTLAAFDAVDRAALTDPALVYRGDRVVSAFDTAWYEAGSPATPTTATWLVESSDGHRSFLVYFERFDGAGDDSPGTVRLRVKRVSP